MDIALKRFISHIAGYVKIGSYIIAFEAPAITDMKVMLPEKVYL
jgi:hypothetical protein